MTQQRPFAFYLSLASINSSPQRYWFKSVEKKNPQIFGQNKVVSLLHDILFCVADKNLFFLFFPSFNDLQMIFSPFFGGNTLEASGGFSEETVLKTHTKEKRVGEKRVKKEKFLRANAEFIWAVKNVLKMPFFTEQ